MSVRFARILAPLDRGLLTEAVYRAMRTITYRDGADNMIKGLILDAGEDKAAEAALTALRKIEDEEQRPIADLTDEQATKYVQSLSTVLDERLHEELKLDEAQGSKELEKLRSLEP